MADSYAARHQYYSGSGEYPSQASQQIWGDRVYREALHNFALRPWLGGEGAGNAITAKHEFMHKKAAVMTMTMYGNLAATDSSGQIGDAPLFYGDTTNEVALTPYNHKCYVNQRRHGTYLVGRMSNFHIDYLNYGKIAKRTLGEWLGAMWEVDAINALLYGYPYHVRTAIASDGMGVSEACHPYWYVAGVDGNKKENTVALTAAAIRALTPTVMDMDDVDQLSAVATHQKIRKVKTPFGPRWLCALHPYVGTGLKHDADWRTTMSNADPTGEKNRLFPGFLNDYGGFLFVESSYILDIGLLDATGTALGEYANVIMGADALAFGVGSKPFWSHVDADHGNQQHYATGQIYGFSRAEFTEDVASGASTIQQGSLVFVAKGVGTDFS